ncbi:MAG TPA: hypothetical protein VFF70_00945 [Anaerolineae bacterium]|nr:hypothetical protein [Anaerolineae bacterium]
MRLDRRQRALINADRSAARLDRPTVGPGRSIELQLRRVVL